MTFMSISGKSIKKFKRVFIHWIDIESSSEWTNTLEGKTYAQNCYSIGWLAVKNKDKTIIFSSYTSALNSSSMPSHIMLATFAEYIGLSHLREHFCSILIATMVSS